jgi:hypothetical protein
LVTCPVCGIDWPSASVGCCPCGFAPVSLDHFTLQMKLLRVRASVKLATGVVMVGAPLALLWMLPMQAIGLVIVGLTAIGTFMIGGAILAVRSMLTIFETTRRLKVVGELKQLPVARIVD